MGIVLLDKNKTKASLNTNSSKDTNTSTIPQSIRVSNWCETVYKDETIPETVWTTDITIKGGWASLPPNEKSLATNPYYQGRKDFLRGRLDNPYYRGSLYAKEWDRGFNAAYFKNLQMLKAGRLILKVKRKAPNKAVTKPGK